MQLQYIGGEGKYAVLGVYNSHSNLPDRCFWGTAHLARRRKVTGLEISFSSHIFSLRGQACKQLVEGIVLGNAVPPYEWRVREDGNACLERAQLKSLILYETAPSLSQVTSEPDWLQWTPGSCPSPEKQPFLEPFSRMSNNFIGPETCDLHSLSASQQFLP